MKQNQILVKTTYDSVIVSKFLKSKRLKFIFTLFAVLFLSISTTQAVIKVVPFTTPGATTWTCPAGVTSITVECWGGGGAGGGAKYTGTSKNAYGGGGSGGGYAKKVISVSPGTKYKLFVGNGGIGTIPTADNEVASAGTASFFIDNSTINANGGVGGNGSINSGSTDVTGTGGVFNIKGQVGSKLFNGGNGGTAIDCSGSGGGSGGIYRNGNNGSSSLSITVAVAAGGPGGEGVNVVKVNNAGGVPGGGGGGSKANSNGTEQQGGDGGAGQITITYVITE